ncbi:MAG TPA: ROK family transcriptional regulator [Epulopiscium sp.]|nr:ROK family transcriptional regulator [Candidatus Epulonipiscium sp.]
MHIDHELMKQSNRSRILNVVYQNKTVTRQEVSRILRISLPTVVSNVADLVEEGILEVAGMATSTGGRKPMIIRFVAHSRYSIGIELKTSKGRIILTNLKSKIIDEIDLKWNKFRIEDVMQEAALLVDKMIKRNNIEADKLLGIGFAIPGIVDEETLYLENAPNLGAKNIDFNLYQHLFPAQIYMENEANTAAYAEAMLADENHNSNLIYLSIKEGIGTGIIIQNQLYKGNNKKAGEFGHMHISMEKRKCSCGRYGCWETFASEKALKNSYAVMTGELGEIEHIMAKVKEKDLATQSVLDQYIDYLVVGIENIILGLSPQYIVLGGNISQYEDIIIPLIESKMGKETTIYEILETKVICSILGRNASILGASLLPIHNLFHYEKITI